jgi:pyruvate/oxaloacetate carboxyltransferase
VNSNPVIFNNTVLRDGHQSLAATRMTTAQMLPAVEALDSIGFGALETWGGATIDSCLRYLGENPFDRLDQLKALTKKTPHMMLLRGQNLVQYTSFPDDVVEAFVACSAKHGMDIFRIFDALNDVRNLHTAVDAVRRAGRHAQGAISYTVSPVHTTGAFLAFARELEEMGCDSICLKDMAGLLTPSATFELIRELKRSIKIPVVLHTHDTAGMGAASYYAAVEAGVDAIDTSIAPFANGTGQPDTLQMLAALERSARRPNYDREPLVRLRRHFDAVYAALKDFTSPVNERVDIDILTYQVPGGMLSNFRNQLKEQGMAGRFDEVMAEIPPVREALGWVPLVTPTSQIIGTQAMMNVKFGRWKMLSQPAADVALGKYGRTPSPVDPEVLKLAMKNTKQEPVTCRPADLLEPRMEKLRAELATKGLPTDDETAVLYAMFPHEVVKFYTQPAPAPAQPQTTGQPSVAAQKSGAAQELHSGQFRYVFAVNGSRHEALIEEIS